MFEQYNEQPAENVPDTIELEQKLSSGANWFYWVAGLSAVNSIINFFEMQWNFAVGLGITQLFDGLGMYLRSEGSPYSVLAAVLAASLVVSGLFFVIGVFANRRIVSAFVIGIILYGLDSVLMLLVGDILGIIIHAIALFFIVRGFLAARQLLRSNTTK
jgi:hypothetical protein